MRRIVIIVVEFGWDWYKIYGFLRDDQTQQPPMLTNKKCLRRRRQQPNLMSRVVIPWKLVFARFEIHER